MLGRHCVATISHLETIRRGNFFARKIFAMKFLQVLPLLLATLVAANDDAEVTSDDNGLLRGSVKQGGDNIVDETQQKRQAQECIPFCIIPRPQSDTPATVPAPVPAPVPEPTATLRPVIQGLGPPTPTRAPVFQTLPIRQDTLDINGNKCGMSTSGTVILHGGIFNYDDPRSDSLGQTIIREMQTNNDNRITEPLVFVPGARSDVTDEDEIAFENQWRDIMAPGVPFSVLHADDEEPDFTNAADAAQADTDGFIQPLIDAKGVFLPGGRQWRFIDAYKYTKTEEELWKVLDRGGVIAGTSAGAAVMSSLMPRGDPLGSASILAEREWYQYGFGFVSNIAVDNHVEARGREMAMYDVLNAKPENRKLLGLGLNENTMAVVKGRYFQVRGDRGVESVVRVYDCSQIPAGTICDYQNAPYSELTPGDWYDLCARRQISAPSLDEDLNAPSIRGAYKPPWSFGKDFKNGNPSKFLCSGRRCRFTSSPIVVDSATEGPMVKIYGNVVSAGSAFSASDRLVVRYRFNDDQFSQTVFHSDYDMGWNSPFGRYIFNALPIPQGKNTLFIEIEAETTVEGEAEYQVSNLMIK